jgi:hypothetical protein
MAIHLASLYAYLPYQHGHHVGGDVGMSVGGYEAEGWSRSRRDRRWGKKGRGRSLSSTGR